MGENLSGLVLDNWRAVSSDPAAVWQRVEADMRALLERHGLGHVRLERGDEPREQTQGGKVRPVIPFKAKGSSP